MTELTSLASVSTVVDPYVAVFIDNNPYWVATLSDNTVIYQDDNRPGLEPSAWLRLRQYCEDNNLNVVNLKLQFAGYQYNAYDGTGDGVYFSRGSSALLGEDLRTWDLYVVGVLRGRYMDVVRYEIPTLQQQTRAGRLVTPKNLPSIIYHTNVRQKVHITNDGTIDHPGCIYSRDDVHSKTEEAP